MLVSIILTSEMLLVKQGTCRYSCPHKAIEFVVRKQKPKVVLEEAQQRKSLDEHEHTLFIHRHPDAHGRLASWIQLNARSYLPIRHPQTTLDVHVSAGLYQIVDLVREGFL
ncbi:unnamed protein product [Strongylus vulgaris]|uniref:Uncharacterized protein n=1 Tax=Strongylus vulgaris TaxID=40348 RepID=A0A3P7IQW4_STRVU|nr:unnamed protein product [Strongylus vulgaris]